MDLDQKYRGLLGKIGFLMCRNGMAQEAKGIFDALAQTGEGKTGPLIGQAMVMLEDSKFDKAIEHLEGTVLKVDPKDQVAKSYLGLAYYMDKQNDKAKDVLQAVIDENSEAAAVELANGIIAEMG
jgi:hypothetical protein